MAVNDEGTIQKAAIKKLNQKKRIQKENQDIITQSVD